MNTFAKCLRCLVAVLIIGLTIAYGEECKVLTVSGSYGWAPYLFHDKETNEISGISYKIINIIGKRLKIPVEFKVDLPWKRVLKMVENGELDMCAAIYWNEERDKIFNYTVPILQDEVRVFVMKGKEFKFESLVDLRGKIGGIPMGASYGSEFDKYAEKHLLIDQGAKDKNALIQKLILGRNDYYVSALFDVSMYLKKEGLLDKVVPLPKPIAINKVYFVMPKSSSCSHLLPKINSVIKDLKKDGTIKRFLGKYMM